MQSRSDQQTSSKFCHVRRIAKFTIFARILSLRHLYKPSRPNPNPSPPPTLSPYRPASLRLTGAGEFLPHHYHNLTWLLAMRRRRRRLPPLPPPPFFLISGGRGAGSATISRRLSSLNSPLTRSPPPPCHTAAAHCRASDAHSLPLRSGLR